jgi:hypothetical protein
MCHAALTAGPACPILPWTPGEGGHDDHRPRGDGMNHWLAVLGENAALVTAALGRDGLATT